MKILRYDLMAIVLSLSIFLLFTWFGLNRSGEAGSLFVEDSKGEYLYPLSEDRTIVFEGPVGESVIEIKDGEAHFLRSDCDDELCVQMGFISEPGEWAACLPNRVFIYTDGEIENGEVDAGVY